MAGKPGFRYNLGVQRFTDFLTRLQAGEVTKAASAAGRIVSFRLRDMVKEEYRKHIGTGALRGIARSTRLAGKEKGPGRCGEIECTSKSLRTIASEEFRVEPRMSAQVFGDGRRLQRVGARLCGRLWPLER